MKAIYFSGGVSIPVALKKIFLYVYNKTFYFVDNFCLSWELDFCLLDSTIFKYHRHYLSLAMAFFLNNFLNHSILNPISYLYN